MTVDVVGSGAIKPKIYDVAVVGSGAIGASIAFELASRGRKVVRIGEVQRETAASMAAGAMNGCFGEITQTLIGSEYGRLKVCMDIEARKLWPAWMARLADKSGNQTSLITANLPHNSARYTRHT
jgi:glycine/D-amino acid oxidase-like deaminating enzyme